MSNQWAEYEPPEIGDMFVPKDNVGHVLVIKPHEVKTGVVTSQSTDGTSAVAADLVDLNAPGGPAIYRNALLFGGAFVDALRPYLGRLVAVRVEQQTSKSGRLYCHPAALDAATTQRARAWVDQNNPFTEPITTVSPVPSPTPPVAQDPWAPARPATTSPSAQAPFAVVDEEPPF